MTLSVPCAYCGEADRIDLLEIWDSRQFMLSDHCEQAEQDLLWGLEHDPE